MVRKIVKVTFYHLRTNLKIDYRKYSRFNEGYKYILVIIDAFSRFAYTAPLKFKTAEESAGAIDKIFEKFRDVPILFSSDKGNEVSKGPRLHSFKPHYYSLQSKIYISRKFWLINTE